MTNYQYYIPSNFDWNIYLSLNPDLYKAGINNEKLAKAHWIKYGQKENRKYLIEDEIVNTNQIYYTNTITENSLPSNFNPKLYKLYNKDLAMMSDNEAIQHYIRHGKKENRIYFCGVNFETLNTYKTEQYIPQQDGAVLLINHDVSKTGAPIFLYDLYFEIINNNIFKNVYIVEPYPNKILPEIDNKIYHFNDPNLLYEIIISTNPSLIYSNSLNLYLHNLDKFEYWYNKTILHFHETYSYAKPIIENIKNNISNIKTYVVSDNIRKEFLSQSSFKDIQIFPPFLSQTKKEKIKKLSKENISDLINIDHKKITIGMCGEPCDRKNLLLFLKLAEYYPEYNFVWVGGDNLEKIKLFLDPDGKYKITDNFYWIPSTTNPYKYFELFDYFFLTSKEDPCPIVVLENLLLNNKIIVIKNNIKTQHDINFLENYIEINSNNENDIITNFKDLNLNKNKNETKNNIKYIDYYYTNPVILNKSQKTKRHHDWLICSLYLDQQILNTNSLNYYINLINQFILRYKNNITFYPIIILSSDYHIAYGDSVRNYLNNSILNIEDGYIIEKNNYGYDIAGLLYGVKKIFDHHQYDISEKSYLAYLHNKNNFSWRNILHSIFYTNNIIDYDTIVSNTFSVNCKLDDFNRNILNNYSDIFENVSNKIFKYIQGTTFITKLNFFQSLYNKFDILKYHFTHIGKDDIYWQEIMKNKDIFLYYYNQYQQNLFNTPIDYHSFNIVTQDSSIKNYIQLYKKYGLKGIPDCQFEHALERYIGYLIYNKSNSNIYLI